MKSINLKLVGINSKVIPTIKVDDQIVVCKKNQFGSFETNIQTEKDEVELSLTRNLELKAKLWWLYALVSFIVSIFGIFEPFYDRKNISIDCKFKIKLNDTNDIKVKFNSLTSQGKAVEIETTNEFEEIINEYKIDKQAKKRWIILLILKIIIWIALAILIGYFIIKRN